MGEGAFFSHRLPVFIATGFNFSLVPPLIADWVRLQPWGQNKIRPNWTGSGLAGAVLGLATYLLLPQWVVSNIFVIAAAVLFSVWVAHYAERIMGVHDDPRIVVDEWVGTWIAMAGLRHAFGFEVVAAFILFRIFDVYKGPWGHRLQRLPGGWGVVMDDVVAGLIANFFARIIIIIAGIL